MGWRSVFHVCLLSYNDRPAAAKGARHRFVSHEMWRKVLNSDKFFEYVWRWTLLVAGMFVAACGIAIITQTNLGTTPISSLPYAVTGLTGYSFGTTTFFINLIFIALQWVILSRKGVFHYTTFFQIPVVFVFSAFIDFTMSLSGGIMPESYPLRLLISFAGNTVLALGIVMQLHSRTIVQPGEGLVIAESILFRKPFGTVKVFNDWTLVLMACLVAFIFSWAVSSVSVKARLVSALFVGIFAKLYLKLWPMQKKEELKERKRSQAGKEGGTRDRERRGEAAAS